MSDKMVIGVVCNGARAAAGPLCVFGVVVPMRWVHHLSDRVDLISRDEIAQVAHEISKQGFDILQATLPVEELNTEGASKAGQKAMLQIGNTLQSRYPGAPVLSYQGNAPEEWVLIPEGSLYVPVLVAARVLAQAQRMKIMHVLALKWPRYGFDKHEGYLTAQHKDAIRLYGATPDHRERCNSVSKEVETLPLYKKWKEEQENNEALSGQHSEN